MELKLLYPGEYYSKRHDSYEYRYKDSNGGRRTKGAKTLELLREEEDQLIKSYGITINNSDETKTVALSSGMWAYNYTGFFESGEITMIGEIQNNFSVTGGSNADRRQHRIW